MGEPRVEVLGLMGVPTSTVGFDAQPARHPVMSFVLFVVVVVLSVSVAVGFRESALWVVEQFGDHRDATVAAGWLHPLALAGLAVGTLLTAAALGRFAATRWPGHAGLEAVAATARGSDRRISARATAVRTLGTWLITVGLAPVGRESAIIESGGAIGSTLARRFGGKGATTAAAGIAAAFAAAYHAPLAAIVYVEEHLQVRGSRRATRFTIGGALCGFLLATQAYGVHRVFPKVTVGWGDLALAGAVAVLPATLAAKAFYCTRTAMVDRARTVAGPHRWWLLAIVGSAIVAAVLLGYPLTAGNGMDAMRQIAPVGTITGSVVLAMSVGKLVGTSATLASGAPGGALTPTIVVGAGAALATVWAAQQIGWGNPDPWAMAVLAGAAAIAVGLRAPLTAIVLLPELTGSYRLLPACLFVVLGAVAVDAGLDRIGRRRQRTERGVRDEDG